MDIVTGTGILAISPAKLGAREALAIDHNQLAVETAWKNVLLNGVEDRVEVSRGKAETIELRGADMVLANLHFTVINDLFTREKFFPKRWIVLSGLFYGQVSQVLASMEKWQHKVHRRMDEKHWVTLILKKIPCRVDWLSSTLQGRAIWKN